MLEHKPEFKPIQPPRRSVPHNHREPLSKHLDLMRREGIIEEVNPNEPINKFEGAVYFSELYKRHRFY